MNTNSKHSFVLCLTSAVSATIVSAIWIAAYCWNENYPQILDGILDFEVYFWGAAVPVIVAVWMLRSHEASTARDCVAILIGFGVVAGVSEFIWSQISPGTATALRMSLDGLIITVQVTAVMTLRFVIRWIASKRARRQIEVDEKRR